MHDLGAGWEAVAVAGYLTEDAVGYLIEIEGVRIYHSGDTDYDRSLLTAGVGEPDVALVCINDLSY